MSVEINVTDQIIEVTPTAGQIDVNITENPVVVDATDQIIEIADTGLQGPQGPAGPGVPTGGTTGQVLSKTSNTNYDTQWVSVGVGSVTSVDASGISGISVSGGPITSSGTLLITNTAPDQIVSLTGTGTTSISGTYPNFTISSADQYTGTVTSVATSAPLTGGTITNSGTIGITKSNSTTDGYLSSTDWNTFNNKQGTLTLTTTGTSGAATLIGNTLNIPQYEAEGNYVTTATTLTINGTTYDLSSNRSWSVGTVTSVDASGGTGISVSGGPITSSGSLTITNTAPDQIVAITGGGTTSVSGTYPNFNISSADQYTGTVTSVGLSMPSAFTVSNSPVTSSGTINVTGAGTANQYVRGDGQLATFPSTAGGGSTVNYYLNGSVNSSVSGYKQMDNNAIVGAGTDFTLTGNGLIAQFLTDAGNPNRILIPGGAWNCEIYFSVNSAGGNQKFYLDLLKYNGTNFTLIASTSTNPEEITGGTSTDLYLTSIAVPTTTLLTTDRLAIRIYIVDNAVGRTVTLHTEDNNLCEIITTFAAGVASLNGLTANTQYLATGTSGSDFNISSVSDTHTFNLPTASSVNRGALSSTDWSTFNNKQSAITLTTTGTSGAATFVGNTLNIPNYGSALSGYVPYTGANNNLTMGVYDISARFIKVDGESGNMGFLGLKQLGSGTLSSLGYTGLSSSNSYTLNITFAQSNGAYKYVQFSTFLWSDNEQFVYQLPRANGTLALSSELSGYVPTNRTLTINGTTYDLSANRSWSVGTVTSVDALTIGTTGTDISSSIANGTTTPVITLNIPTASATNRGALSSSDWSAFNNKENVLSFTSPLSRSTNTISIPAATSSINGYLTSADWTTFNGKQNAITLTTTGSSGASTFISNTLNIPNYTLSGLGGVPTTRTLTINGTAYDLSADRSWSVGTVTSITTSGPLTGGTITGSGIIGIIQAGIAYDGYLSSTDWNTFNNKQNALTNPVTGTGTTNYVPKFTGASTLGNSNLINDASGNLGLGVTPSAWGGAFKAIQFTGLGALSTSTGNATYLSNNWFFDTGDKYIGSAHATVYYQYQGGHFWLTAPSGTAGAAITFTQAMTLNASGRLLLGTTTDNGTDRLQVNGSANITGNLTIDTNTLFVDATNNRVGIGTASPAAKLDVNGNISFAYNSGATDRFIVRSFATAHQAADVPNNTYFGVTDTGYAGGTFVGMRVGGERNGANTLNNYYVDFTSHEGGVSAGIRMRIAPNGNVGIGTTSPVTRFDVVGGAGSISGTSFYNGSFVQDQTNYRGVLFGYDTSGQIGVIGAQTSAAASNLAFWTYSGSVWAERMRITSGGNLLVGTSTDNGVNRLQVSGGLRTIVDNTISAITIVNTSSSNKQWDISPFNNNLAINESNVGTRMYFQAGGEVIISGTTDNGAYNLQVNGTGVWGAGAYVNGSDIRLKDNIKDIDEGLSLINKIRPVSFTYKEDYSKDRNVQTGFIAQELQEVFKDKDYLNGLVQEGPQHLNVAYQNIIPILVKAIQEQQIQIDNLKKQII